MLKDAVDRGDNYNTRAVQRRRHGLPEGGEEETWAAWKQREFIMRIGKENMQEPALKRSEENHSKDGEE